MVALQILVLSVLVRIRIPQRKEPALRSRFLFSSPPRPRQPDFPPTRGAGALLRPRQPAFLPARGAETLLRPRYPVFLAVRGAGTFLRPRYLFSPDQLPILQQHHRLSGKQPHLTEAHRGTSMFPTSRNWGRGKRPAPAEAARTISLFPTASDCWSSVAARGAGPFPRLRSLR